MRRVPLPPAPPSLSGEKARAERDAVEKFYANWDGTSKFDKFNAYKAPDVRAALTKAFDGRCAYCECDYDKSQPMAIEHYRPKGGVKINGVLTPPGYYWLASEWTNLLPSCTDCNSPRKQELPGSTATAGKANAFPVSPEHTRATRSGEEDAEGRLLLHPYFDQPEEHLEFVWDTHSISDGWIQAKEGDSGPSAKGTATIDVCALQRRGLCAARRNRLIMILGALESVAEAKDNVMRYPDDPAFKQQFSRRLDDLNVYVKDGAEFSAMARQVVATFRSRLFGN